MSIPTNVPDRQVYRGDPFSMQVNFPTDTDITGSTFTANLSDGDGDWTIDATHLAAHYIILSLDAVTTAAITGTYANWDLAEAPLFGRTILAGRLQLSGQV